MAPIVSSGNSRGLDHKAANVTLWRASSPDPDGNSVGDSLLTAGYTFSKNNLYNNYQRNTYFAYQPFNRVAGKLTTRSNVYAVWITIGYFEVSPWYGATSGVPNPSGPQVFDQAHPDGYQLGQELGADTGEIERHRGFYIIDRTIPVGFQRGVDNNVNNCILLKRFIE